MSTATTGAERVVLTNIFTGTMTDGKTDPQLTFDFATNTLNCTNFNGAFTGNVSGNASSATTAGNLSIGSANQVVFKNASNNAATSSNLTFDATTLSGAGLEIKLEDEKRLLIGSGNDLELLHDTEHSIIREQGTGNFYLQSDEIIFITKTNGTDVMGEFNATGAVKLHWNGITNPSVRLETTETGVLTYGNLESKGDVIAFSASDMTLKKDISPIENALDMINKLSGNTFTWNTDLSTLLPYENGTKDTGILAQEVEALGLPGVTTTRGDGVKAVRYDRLIPVLIEAVKELSAKVNSLENNK
jgi:hypothetical protein